MTSATSDITFDADLRTFTIGPRLSLFQVILQVEVTVELANLFDSATTSFEILYQQAPESEAEN